MAYAVALHQDTVKHIPFYPETDMHDGLVSKSNSRILVGSAKNKHYLNNIGKLFYHPEWVSSIDTFEGYPFYYAPDPFMKWDAAENKLRLHYGQCMRAYNTRHKRDRETCEKSDIQYYFYASEYSFQDTALVKVSDSTWNIPELEELKYTFHRETIQVGPHEMDIKSTAFYQEAARDERIEKRWKTLYSIDDFFEYETDARVIPDDRQTEELNVGIPEIKTLNDEAHLMKFSETIVPGHSGMCGACEINETTFYIVDDDGSEEVLSFTTSFDRNLHEYRFKKIEKGYITGGFKLGAEGNNGSMYPSVWVSWDWVENSKVKALVKPTKDADIDHERTYVFEIKSEGGEYYVEKDIIE